MSGLPAAVGLAVALAPVEWRAPAQCPDGAEIERRARALGPEVAPLRVDGDVTQADDGTFVLELAIGDAPPRRYVARDCDALGDVAALLLAVAIDPIAIVDSTPLTIAAPVPDVPPAPRIAAPTPIEASPQVSVTQAPARASARERPAIEGFVRVHGLFGIGELPRFDAGLGLAFGIGAGRGRFELHGAHLFARTAALPGTPRGSVAIASWNLSPRGCAVLGRRSVRAALCAGPELGLVTARGRDLAVRDRTLVLWVAAIAAPGLEWAILPWLRLHAGVELVAALRRPQFAARERPDDRVTLGAGGLRATVGVAGHFGPGVAAVQRR